MKKLILTCFTLLGVILSFQSCDKEDIIFPEYPQDKLQFNKVVLTELENTVVFSPASEEGGYLDSAEIIVSPEKVLKIENAIVSTLGNGANIGNWTRLYLENAILIAWEPSGEIQRNNLPYWLPAGTYKLKLFVAPTIATDTLYGKQLFLQLSMT